MTPKYWTGVFVGILAVFAVGMLVARGVRRGRDLVTSNFPASLSLLNAGFRVDGRQVGDIQRLQFMRSEPGQVDSAVLTVKATSSEAAERLAHCSLWVENHNQVFGSGTRFRCATSNDSAALNLVPFGHVRMMPDDDDVTLFVPNGVATSAHRAAYRGAGGDTGDVDIQHSDGSLSITVNGREMFHASGDSNGGSLVIRGADGKPIIDISGDDKGGHVKITDGNGKTRVDIHGSGSAKHDSD